MATTATAVVTETHFICPVCNDHIVRVNPGRISTEVKLSRCLNGPAWMVSTYVPATEVQNWTAWSWS